MYESKSQTLITGVYRTGTEYISQLINCHPHISVTMYSVNILRFIYNKYNPISKKDNYIAALDSLYERIQERYNLILNKGEIIEVLSKYKNIDYGILYDVVMRSLYLKPPAECWAEKNQLLWREIPIFLNMMPNGKAILIVRDPRSILLSFKKYTYAKPPAYIGAVFNALDAMQHGLEYTNQYPDQFCSIRYEDAAINPDETVRKIWHFLGLKGEYQINNQPNWVDAYGNPWHANSSFHKNDDLRSFDVESSINRWKTDLNEKEISLVEGVCGEMMQKYDYSLTVNTYDWLSIMRLFAHDDTITDHFRKWLLTGKGIELFPTDPVDPKNWERTTNKQS